MSNTAIAKPEPGPLRRLARDFLRSKVAVVAFSLLFIILILAAFAPLIAPQNPYDLRALDVLDGRLQPGEVSDSGFRFLLGSDDQGRDIFSAILYGLRISVGIGVLSTLFALLIGASLGLMAGFLGGRVESIIMRAADLQLSFPPILLALILLALL